MVDVTDKPSTLRQAEARGTVALKAQTLELIRNYAGSKGDVLAVARIAGVLAAKRTADLIPLCHPLPLTSVELGFELDDHRSSVEITARVKTEGKTGVEMEALTAVAVAALTIYDMCKAVDRAMTIEHIRLTFKTGGKSGTYESE